MNEGFQLKSSVFRRERARSWAELDRLLQHARARGLPNLTVRELSRLATLYRACTSSLSVARSISLDRNVGDYLSALASRAYLIVYGTRQGLGAGLAGYLTRFPMLVRRHALSIGLAAAAMLLGTLVAFLLTLHDPEHYYEFMGAGMSDGRDPSATTEELRDTLYGDGDDGSLTLFASFLFQHNSWVGILAFALGFVAGLPTFLLMFYNGLTLGAFVALFHSRGLGGEVWAWLLPHGITELGAIALCGGAGLILARSLVFPGRHTRRENLAIHGREAGQIVMGAVLMLALAALLEGFFRQLVQSVPVRATVASLSALLWVIYFGWVGRPRAAGHQP